VRTIKPKCLHQPPKGDWDARKGIWKMLLGAWNISSEGRVADGTLELNSEGLLYYSLLLGGGDTNNRGEDNEGFNTPVCRLR
jgi:hypothetical protein